jgi:hypothetical protein
MQTGRWKFTAVTTPDEKLAVAYRKAGHCGVNLHPAGFPRDIQYLETAVRLSRPQKTAQNSRLRWKIWDSLI